MDVMTNSSFQEHNVQPKYNKHDSIGNRECWQFYQCQDRRIIISQRTELSVDSSREGGYLSKEEEESRRQVELWKDGELIHLPRSFWTHWRLKCTVMELTMCMVQSYYVTIFISYIQVLTQEYIQLKRSVDVNCVIPRLFSHFKGWSERKKVVFMLHGWHRYCHNDKLQGEVNTFTAVDIFIGLN